MKTRQKAGLVQIGLIPREIVLREQKKFTAERHVGKGMQMICHVAVDKYRVTTQDSTPEMERS